MADGLPLLILKVMYTPLGDAAALSQIPLEYEPQGMRVQKITPNYKCISRHFRQGYNRLSKQKAGPSHNILFGRRREPQEGPGRSYSRGRKHTQSMGGRDEARSTRAFSHAGQG